MKIIYDIENGKLIKVKINNKIKSVKFENNDFIKNTLKPIQNNSSKYYKKLYSNDKHKYVFKTTDGDLIRFIDIEKTQYSQINKKINTNTLGSKLTNAIELATIESLYNDINSPEDTKQKLFINGTIKFDNWAQTFKNTKIILKKIIKDDIKKYKIIHSATDNSEFSKIIRKFLSKMNISKQDNWNTSDIYIIKKTSYKNIKKQLKIIIDDNNVNNIVNNMNNYIYNLFKNDELYPISLKQITDDGKYEYNNIPNNNPNYTNYNLEKINISLFNDTNEIGLILIRDDDNNTIPLQIRGYPHGYNISQLEIGSYQGGRVGKIPIKIVDEVFKHHEHDRISSIKYFGKPPNYFSEFNEQKIKDVVNWYNFTIKNINYVKNLDDVNNLTVDFLSDYINVIKKDLRSVEKMCHKIQGLNIVYFLLKNVDNISNIINTFINAAKKIDTSNSFFIKIY
jgi:hypothetical protein